MIGGAIPLRVEPLTGTVGAVVAGIDVRRPQTGEVSEALVHALHEHGVLSFSAVEPVTDQEFLDFASLFGEVLVYPYGRPDAAPRPILVLDSVDAPADRFGANRWHTDGTPEQRPPQAALLTPRQLPPVGGDTMWASMSAAYDALSSHTQRLLDDMDALHSTANLARRFGSAEDAKIFGSDSSFVHPVVIRDAVTGRRMLYVNSNYTERLIGPKPAEGERLLEMLFEHVNTPELHVRIRWHPTTIVVWEERVTQHRAVFDYAEPRIMRRITIQGDQPAR